MLDIAIIGGGLCGLALATQLQKRGRSFAIFEARSRWGGRILSYDCRLSGLAVDLGAAWFWPDRHPMLTSLIAELGLESFAQHDEGVSLRLSKADEKPEMLEAGGLHGGARRLTGGAQKITDALRAGLPPESLHLETTLKSLRDCGDHLDLTLLEKGVERVISARNIVLALPPRLIEERIAAEPAFDDSLRQAMREAPTWMAVAAKAVSTYERPLWRLADRSGNAFVTHEQAVLDEVFDASDAGGGAGALGGFVALNPEQREAFSDGLPLLLQSQFEQLFGHELSEKERFYQDWAQEDGTCSTLDREHGREDARLVANPMLRRPLWGGKLHLAGSETAARQAGYMEGALEAARRVARDIFRLTPEQSDTLGRRDGESLNAFSLRTFAAWVDAHGEAVFDDYRRRLTLALARQERDQLTQKAMLGAAEDFFARALAALGKMPFEPESAAVDKGRCALTPAVQKPFGAFLSGFFDDVAAFNGTSCALSNFASESHLSQAYRQVIVRDFAAAWTEFSLAANRLLLAKTAEMAKN